MGDLSAGVPRCACGHRRSPDRLSVVHATEPLGRRWAHAFGQPISPARLDSFPYFFETLAWQEQIRSSFDLILARTECSVAADAWIPDAIFPRIRFGIVAVEHPFAGIASQ